MPVPLSYSAGLGRGNMPSRVRKGCPSGLARGKHNPQG